MELVTQSKYMMYNFDEKGKWVLISLTDYLSLFSEKNAQTKVEQMMEAVHLDMESVVLVSNII